MVFWKQQSVITQTVKGHPPPTFFLRAIPFFSDA